jgi:predicted nucleotidyltransferase
VSFASMLAGLAESRVAFVVVGGVAGALHGSERVTNDLDVVYDASDPNTVEALASLLARWRAYPRGVERGLPFIVDARTLRSTPVLTLTTTEGDLDLLDRIDGIGDYADVSDHAEPIEALGIAFRILDLPTLIRAKKAAGRAKDREALLELEVLAEQPRRKPPRRR